MTSFDTAGFLLLLPLSLAAIVVAFGVTLVVALHVGRHNVVDVTWGLGFALVAWVGVAVGGGDLARRVLVAAGVTVWGVRLAVHIGRRSVGRGEDPRYVEMLEKAGGHPVLTVVRKVYLTQAVVMWFVSLPLQANAFGVAPLTAGLPLACAVVGAVVWAVGVTFETVGDRQLDTFRADPASKGQVLDTGLWRFTRHPNYFGDACTWWGVFVVCAGAWPAVLFVLSPVAMTWLLAKGTGKPLLEKDMASRRPGYAEYVSRTSGFVPLPPRRT